MLIKHKLISNTIVTIVSMVAMLVLMNFASSSFKQDITIAQNIGNIESGIWQLRSHEKDFITRKKSEYIDTFNTEITLLQTEINELKGDLKNIGTSVDEAKQLSQLLNDYQQIFSDVVETQRRIGFDPQSGYYGQLREAAHSAEEEIGDSVTFYKMMLQIRSSEKNYMLLLDDKYINTFIEDYDNLYASVKKSYLVTSQKNSILSSLDAYKEAFMSLVHDQQLLGYHSNDGLQKKMNESAAQVNQILDSLVTRINQAVTEYMGSIKQLTYIFFAAALLISIIITWFISHSIMSAILHIKNSIVKISETNDLTIAVSTKSNDELSDMAVAFNYMISNFQSLLSSVKKSQEKSESSEDLLADNPLWADFIYDELLEGKKEDKE